MAHIEDGKAAVRFLRANASKYGLDPDHFGAWGGSAGGHLVALLGTSGDVTDLEGDGSNPNVSRCVQAVCDIFGPANLLTIAAQSGNDSTIQHDAPDSPESLLLGGPVRDRRDAARPRASPVTYIRARRPESGDARGASEGRRRFDLDDHPRRRPWPGDPHARDSPGRQDVL